MFVGGESDLFVLNIQQLRTVLLLMLVVACGGCFLLEQPFGSLFEFFPRWRYLVTMLQDVAGRHAVTCQLRKHMFANKLQK